MLLARDDERCGFEVGTYRMSKVRRVRRVLVTLTGRIRGAAAFKIVGRKVSMTNKLWRRIARGGRCDASGLDPV